MSTGPLLPRRHLKQYLIGALVMSAVVLASVALVISLRRPGHPTVVIHVTNSSGMDDVAVPLKDDAQKATDDVSDERLGTRLWLKDSTERVQKRAELQEFVTTPGFSPQVSLGPQTSPADDLLTKIKTSLPHPPSPPSVVIDPVGTTLGGSGKRQPLTMPMIIDPPTISPQIDPEPQQSTATPTPFEQHAPDTTPQPNDHNQTPFKSQTPLRYMYNFKPIPPMTPALPPTCTTTAAPSTAMSTAKMLNITCQDKKELCAGTGTFSSPEYPEKYPKYQCITWRITTDPGNCITITFQNFSVERNLQCKFDKVWVVTNGKTVYGPMCGTDLPRPQRGREVELTFLSDGSMGMTGFKVRYSSQAGDGPDCG
ncbi:uncharacterized protein [Branchiostoma lanceolatum]|uniref:uncharacterized protein n=1 Tax=Branchiostoma lanceolatum TaxID=7740 RepID=UPI003453EEA2